MNKLVWHKVENQNNDDEPWHYNLFEISGSQATKVGMAFTLQAAQRICDTEPMLIDLSTVVPLATEVAYPTIVVDTEYEALLERFKVWGNCNGEIKVQSESLKEVFACRVDFSKFNIEGLEDIQMFDPDHEEWYYIKRDNFLDEYWHITNKKWVNIETGEEHE